MKQTMRKLICLMLAILLPVAASAAALAETAAGQDAAYIVTGYRYADSASGQLTLYDDQLAPIGSVANGARLTVTNGEKDGYIFVRFGAVSGWAAVHELSADAPETDSAPTLIPIQTDAPAAETETDETETVPEAAPAAPTLSPAAPQDDEAAAGEEDEETADGEEPADEDAAADEDAPADEDAAADEDAPADEDAAADEDAPTDEDAAADEDTPSDGDDNSNPAAPQAPDGDAAADETAAAAYENTHAPIAALYTTEDGDTEAVNVVLLGAVTCLLDTEEGILPVETTRLTFTEELDEAKKLGYVHAPRTGKAGLREQPSKSSKTLAQLKAGQLVAVLALDGDFAHVNAQGQEGWLRLDCLRYLEPADEGMVAAATGGNTAAPADVAEAESGTTPVPAEDAQDVLIAVEGQQADRRHYPQQAQLSCQAETDGGTSVNLRNLPTRESAKTAVWRTGKEVTVLSAQEGWYLVEANGTCGYVMEAFLTFYE